MNKPFSWRIFISFGLCIAFIILLVSGVILYIAPSGKPASGVAFRLIGLTKPEWQNQHIIFGFAFSVIALFHLLVINWKAFVSYLKAKASEGFKSPVEFFVIVLLTVLFGLGTYYKIQPFSSILEFGKSVSKTLAPQGVKQPGMDQGAGGAVKGSKE
ncbi:MAG: DUF4405 domain-containing protein [Chlorobiaceae bacterium]|nr:DUF4405 domain-containing protein [Chlorobiaceae bacterium]